MKKKTAATLLAILVAFSGCSEELRFERRGTVCVRHQTDRLFGIPLMQEESTSDPVDCGPQ